MADRFGTKQAEMLLKAGACSEEAARLVGLLFAERDPELIECLKESPSVPGDAEFPRPELVQMVLGVEKRWADFSTEKLHRFVHKRRMNGDYSADVQAFARRPDVARLAGECQGLRKGTTVFLGDSLMDPRHFSANATFPILVAGVLEAAGAGPSVNAGIGGNTTAQGLARFDRDVLAHRPVRVVLSFGSNDLANGVPIPAIVDRFTMMIAQCKAVGTEVLLGLLSPVVEERLWWPGAPTKNVDVGSRRALQEELMGLAAREGTECIEVLERLRPEHYCVDGIHLNQAGQELCGVEVLGKLVRAVGDGR